MRFTKGKIHFFPKVLKNWSSGPKVINITYFFYFFEPFPNQSPFKVFDTNNSGELDFTEFVRGLAMFTTKNIDREKKLKFLFNIYDMDSDGFICNTELFEVCFQNGNASA